MIEGFIALEIQGTVGVGVYSFLEKHTDRFGKVRPHIGKIAVACSLLFLYALHVANVKGLI